ncbi:hypothetical protein F2Q69_00011068 [Brassica cretica]|uniref:Uncharacterized protein n=1 Tax=Brassica cretica TaxID=69181 RepID=A0A8S9QVH3_BRACR|nr:hypothetical protein F2Q69_00011068 [Brassica cretica]
MACELMGDLFAKSFSLKPRRLTRHISSRVLSDESLILAKARVIPFNSVGSTYRPICVEITGSTWKHFCTTYELREYMEELLYYVAIVCVEISGRTGKHFCTTHELREYREVLLYYVALCMRRMWEYREAILYYAYFWCRVCFMLELRLHSRSAT